MDIFSIDVTHNELNFIRQSLDTVQISGKDAKFLANLQIKVEQELINIQQMKQQEEQKKLLALSQTVEGTKNSSKK
jgi:hypothetical protein